MERQQAVQHPHEDMKNKENKSWADLREILLPGMKAPNSEFIKVTSAEVIRRNRANSRG